MKAFAVHLAAALLLVGAHTALAHGGHVQPVGSDADGSGQLVLDWDFAGNPIARTFATGFPGVFSGDVPGFDDATDAPPDFWALASIRTPTSRSK